MDNHLQSRVDEFDEAISLWKAVYRWRIVSFVAVKTARGPKLLFGRILFEPLRPKLKNWTFESSSLIAGRQVESQEPESSGMYSSALEGSIEADGLLLPLDRGNQVNLSAFVHTIRHPANVDGPRTPHLVIYGAQRFQLQSDAGSLDKINWDLKAADQPFNDLDDLFRYLGLPSSQQMSESTTLEFIADYPAIIAQSSKIKSGVATIDCVVTDILSPNKIKIGYVTFDQMPVERKFLSGAQFKWTKKAGVRHGTIKLTLGKIPSLLCFLSYDGIAMHQWWITDPGKIRNPYKAIYEAIDPDLNIMSRLLSSTPKTPANDLEQGVAILFSMLGLPGLQIGQHQLLRDGPDLLVGGIVGQLLVVECTTGNLDQNNKLSKLSVRTEAIREKLNLSGHSNWKILPVIVSSLPKAAIPRSQFITAAENGIAVLAAENLADLKNRVHNQPDPSAVFLELRRWIPKKSD